MGLLAETDLPHADISAELTTLSFSYLTADAKTAIARVDLSGIFGSGRYLCQLFLNNQEVDPEFGMSIGAITAFSSVSRPFSINVGDIILVKVLGLPQDTDVQIITTLTELAITKAGVLEALGEFFPQDMPIDTSNLTQSLRTCINGWSSALAIDAMSPQPSYSVDGESYQRNEWRQMLLESIIKAKTTINALNPYIGTTRQVL